MKLTPRLFANRRASVLLCAIGIFAYGALSACGRNIGDECQLNTDCSANGDRTCDLSQPGGYCTIEGCDESSCPSESACVRFFPFQFLKTRCNPSCEDIDPTSDTMPEVMCSAAGPSVPMKCMSGKQNHCAADQVCVPVTDMPPVAGTTNTDGTTVSDDETGLCAPRSSERRLCVKTCGGNDDCRGGYTCRPGGNKGSLPLLTNSCGNVNFCAPLGT